MESRMSEGSQRSTVAAIRPFQLSDPAAEGFSLTTSQFPSPQRAETPTPYASNLRPPQWQDPNGNPLQPIAVPRPIFLQVLAASDPSPETPSLRAPKDRSSLLLSPMSSGGRSPVRRESITQSLCPIRCLHLQNLTACKRPCTFAFCRSMHLRPLGKLQEPQRQLNFKNQGTFLFTRGPPRHPERKRANRL